VYKVLIVDDEPIVRLAIKSLINWEAYNYSFELEASNGKQALKILDENPEIDIVITDINMPVMNGLELITKIKKLDHYYQIVVLSAHNEYNLVRQAFKLGACDYILKTEMDSDIIIKLLNSIIKNVDLKKKQPDTQKKQLKENFLRNLIVSRDDQNYNDLEHQVKEYKVNLSERNLVVCILWIDDYEAAAKRYDNNDMNPFIVSVTNAIYQILNDIGVGEVISLSSKEYLVMLSIENISSLKIRYMITDILSKIKYSLQNYVNISVSIGVSRTQDGYSSIPALLKEAKSNVRMRFLLGKGRIIYPEHTENITDSDQSGKVNNCNDFIQALREGNSDSVVANLENLLKSIKKVKHSKIEKVYNYYLEILFNLINYLDEIGEDGVEVFGKEIDFYQKITRFETIEEINVWIRNITAWIIAFLQDKKNVKMGWVIAKSKEFIKLNYSNNITLKMVSEYVNLSESHFSSLFTKTTGCTFVDYLTNLRIEAAKVLMSNTCMKIYEISSKVGYANVEHFSRVFKKITGSSPVSYKKLHGQ